MSTGGSKSPMSTASSFACQKPTLDAVSPAAMLEVYVRLALRGFGESAEAGAKVDRVIYLNDSTSFVFDSSLNLRVIFRSSKSSARSVSASP